MSELYEQSSADFSPCRSWRYRLDRVWNRDAGLIAWIMCNPSVADEDRLDPTLRRVRGFTESWGYGGFVVVNLFALVSTDPRGLAQHPDPIGERNDDTLAGVVDLDTSAVVVAWGCIGGRYPDRVDSVTNRLHDGTLCLGLTKGGHPKHPLYVSASTKPVRYFDVAESAPGGGEA